MSISRRTVVPWMLAIMRLTAPAGSPASWSAITVLGSSEAASATAGASALRAISARSRNGARLSFAIRSTSSSTPTRRRPASSTGKCRIPWLYGFDTASSLGEETHDPRRTAPKAILRAINASFVLGGLILPFAILSVSNINSEEIKTGGLQFVVLDVLGSTMGKIFLICVAIAITVCCLAVHTATIRMMFAMAHDNNLPAGEQLAKVHPKTKTPIVPAVIVGILALLILVVNIRQPQIFTVITSIGIIMIYVAYLLVTVPMLVSRVRGRWPPKALRGEGYFTLGKLGLPVNLLAVVWGAGMAINLGWPRKDVYNATEPFHWYLQYGAVLFISIVFFGGLAYYWFVQRHQTGVLASHALEGAPAAGPAPGAVRPAPAGSPPE